ncbi:MAG: hypothetical protein ACE5KE_01945, partial [Methanosarcinales archaeon]
FNLTENVYCYAGNLSANDVVDIYVVNNSDSWDEGDTLTDVSGGAETVTTDSSGNINVTMIWSTNLTVGKYDIVVDLDQDGVYDDDEPVDSLDTTGFDAIPEFPSVAIPIASVIVLLLLFAYRRRNKL